MPNTGRNSKPPTRQSVEPRDPVGHEAMATTSNRLSTFQRGILEKLLQIPKLTNAEIAVVLDCDKRTIQRRRLQFNNTGAVSNSSKTAKNAEKMKQHHVERLQEWLKDDDDMMLEDMQNFLKAEFGLMISVATISRKLKEATGGSHRKNGRGKRMKQKKLREAGGQPPATGDPEGEGRRGPDVRSRDGAFGIGQNAGPVFRPMEM